MPAGSLITEGLPRGEFKFNLLPEDNLAVKALNGLDLMAEYDARTVNIGAHYQLWKDHINLIAELNNGKYFSGAFTLKSI